MTTSHYFSIADWQICICFAQEDDKIGIHLLPSFAPFATEAEGEPLLTMTVDQSLCEADGKRVRTCDTGSGDIIVDLLGDGGFQFLIKNIADEPCALMQSNADFTECRCRLLAESELQRTFGLNNAMMLAYAFAGARHGTLLVHASVVRHAKRGYAFIAKSGTGKSTQVNNWVNVIPDCDLMNDDNPVIRIIDGESWIYGSPWSGKTPCYRQVKAPLGAVTQIVRAQENRAEKMPPIMGFNALVSSCSAMKWDKASYHGVCDTVSTILETTGCYALHCTADKQSAIVCYEFLTNTERG